MKLRVQILVLLGVFVLLLGIYTPTLLNQINGSSDDLMADVGETQIVLNVWGTLHATGYPLFCILGNLLVSGMRWLGVQPATAPSLVSLIFGLSALAIFYALALNLTGRIALAAGATLLLGLTRHVWLYNVVAEVYSFALLLLLILFALALWRETIPHRIEWLAFIGGMALAHHRGFVLAIPPLLYATWNEWSAQTRQQPQRIFIWLLLGVIGFVPYIYLPMRAQLGGIWVYGEPGTLSGLWDQFIARENPAIMRVPALFEVVAHKWMLVNELLHAEVTTLGVFLGILGLGIGVLRRNTRHVASTLGISAIVAYAFVVILFDDTIAPVIFPMTLAFIVGWLLLGEALVHTRQFTYAAIAPIACMCSALLLTRNTPFISNLTHDTTGLETIALASNTPANATLMLTWGTRYFAIGFAQDVLGHIKHFQRADDKADLAILLGQGMLVTPEFILTDRPPQWFEKTLGRPIFVRAVAPRLVQIDLAPEQFTQAATSAPNKSDLPVAQSPQVRCTNNSIILDVHWVATTQPTRDASVMVHLLDANGTVLAQDDQSAPVYGWRPLTSWQAREIVHDVYALPRKPNAANIRLGWYEKLASGEFKNYDTITLPVTCNP